MLQPAEGNRNYFWRSPPVDFDQTSDRFLLYLNIPLNMSSHKKLSGNHNTNHRKGASMRLLIIIIQTTHCISSNIPLFSKNTFFPTDPVGATLPCQNEYFSGKDISLDGCRWAMMGRPYQANLDGLAGIIGANQLDVNGAIRRLYEVTFVTPPQVHRPGLQNAFLDKTGSVQGGFARQTSQRARHTPARGHACNR